MTDEEMIKAMEICMTIGIPCDDCPLAEYDDCDEISRQYFYERFKCLKTENAALRERLGKWAVDNEIVMESRVKDGQTYYVISRKERRIITHYICTELTPEAAEARLKELQGGKE